MKLNPRSMATGPQALMQDTTEVGCGSAASISAHGLPEEVATSHKDHMSISKAEQKQRLAERRGYPLTQWAFSPIDDVATKYRGDYSAARDSMLLGSHTAATSRQIVRTDSKRHARVNLMRDILSRLHYADRKKKFVVVDRNIVFEFRPDCMDMQRLAP